MTVDEILEKALFNHGHEAIADFLGYNYPEDEDKDTTSNRIEEVISQMPVEVYNQFVQKYVNGITAYNIIWDVDTEELYDKFDAMTAKEAATVLECDYENMNDKERHDFIYDRFHHHKVDAAEFVGLPNEVHLPKDVIDIDDIRDYLSDEYGYCFDGFDLKETEI